MSRIDGVVLRIPDVILRINLSFIGSVGEYKLSRNNSIADTILVRFVLPLSLKGVNNRHMC